MWLKDTKISFPMCNIGHMTFVIELDLSIMKINTHAKNEGIQELLYWGTHRETTKKPPLLWWSLMTNIYHNVQLVDFRFTRHLVNASYIFSTGMLTSIENQQKSTYIWQSRTHHGLLIWWNVGRCIYEYRLHGFA